MKKGQRIKILGLRAIIITVTKTERGFECIVRFLHVFARSHIIFSESGEKIG